MIKGPGGLSPLLGNEVEESITIRDYACIHLKVPKTGKAWLDALITESLRNE